MEFMPNGISFLGRLNRETATARVIRPKVPELITTPTWRDALSKRVPPRVAVTNNETGVVVASPLQLKQLVSRPVTLSRLFVS